MFDRDKARSELIEALESALHANGVALRGGLGTAEGILWDVADSALEICAGVTPGQIEEWCVQYHVLNTGETRWFELAGTRRPTAASARAELANAKLEVDDPSYEYRLAHRTVSIWEAA